MVPTPVEVSEIVEDYTVCFKEFLVGWAMKKQKRMV
jgi:hypothetical protein